MNILFKKERKKEKIFLSSVLFVLFLQLHSLVRIKSKNNKNMKIIIIISFKDYVVIIM